MLYFESNKSSLVLGLEGNTDVRVSRDVKKGQPITADDIVELEGIDFGVVIPPDCGVFYVFSVGWRKGFYFDFSPFHEGIGPRGYDIASVFGQVHAFLIFQERFQISELEWGVFFEKRWFPFIGLPMETVKTMLRTIRTGWDLDELTDQVAKVVEEGVDEWQKSWSDHPVFDDHLDVISTAVDRYREGDYLSTTALLYPRIEGLMRSHHALVGSNEPQSQNGLASSAVPNAAERRYSPMLSDKFSKYLREVYFASFDPESGEHTVSRNTVGHGVVSESELSKKFATIGFLIVRQLYFSFVAVRA